MSKTVNYTPEMTKDIIEVYQAADTESARDEALDTLAEKYSKTVNSIRSKLAMEKVYIPKAKPAKKGTSEKKEDIISDIASTAEKQDGFFDSMANVNKTVLEFVRDLQGQISELQDTVEAYKTEFGDLPTDEESDENGS